MELLKINGKTPFKQKYKELMIDQYRFGTADYMPKVTHWLDGSIAESFTLSGSKVLTWTDKVNGNIWTDFNAGYNVTKSTDAASFYSGGLYFTNSIYYAKEVAIVHYSTNNS